MGDLFKEFYKKQRGVEPTDEMMELFLKIAGEEGNTNEAQET
jgi:exonuclease SbcD